jgi:hypothetical protein
VARGKGSPGGTLRTALQNTTVQVKEKGNGTPRKRRHYTPKQRQQFFSAAVMLFLGVFDRL